MVLHSLSYFTSYNFIYNNTISYFKIIVKNISRYILANKAYETVLLKNISEIKQIFFKDKKKCNHK